jgi:hypothetical protein
MTTYLASPDGRGNRLTGADGRTTTLDDVMGLSEPPVRVTHEGGDVLVTTLPGEHAPESLPDDDDAELIREARAYGWEPVSGFSGQYAYRGPIMHASERIGGGLARHILATPGDYAVATVDDLDTGEPSGWVVLYREPAPTSYSIGDRVRTNVIHGRDDYAATGVVYDTRPRCDGGTDYMVRLDEPATMAGRRTSLFARSAAKLRRA